MCASNEGGIIRAARTDMYNRSGEQTMEGEGGNYDEPEVNLYAGLQDHGHTYFANSLFYAADMKDIMIYGEGLIDGSYMDDSGTLINVLSGSDPSNRKTARTGATTAPGMATRPSRWCAVKTWCSTASASSMAGTLPSSPKA